MAALDAEPVDLSAVSITVIVCYERHTSTVVVGRPAAIGTGKLRVGCAPRAGSESSAMAPCLLLTSNSLSMLVSDVAAHCGGQPPSQAGVPPHLADPEAP